MNTSPYLRRGVLSLACAPTSGAWGLAAPAVPSREGLLADALTQHGWSCGIKEGLSRAQECRQQGGTCQLAAGGALDVLHGFTGSVGYSF